ncbi:MAG: hypothetical protein IPF58_17355 [Saprospirales bacterium]|nr:hypothetical protein [Saprospirales bacterium]
MSLTKIRKTAIILCDEKLLNPLLYNIDASAMNITKAGFSIAEIELFQLGNLYHDFMQKRSNWKIATDYYDKDITALSNHLYLKKNGSKKKN